MRSSLVVLTVLGMVCAVSNAWADTPPPWDRGDSGATSATWDFDDGSNPAAPTSSSGTAPAPSISISGEFPQIFWYDDYPDGGTHTGVWLVEGEDMTATVPNYDIDNPVKDIWLQITYLADMPPNVWMWPLGGGPTDMTLEGTTDLGDGYSTSIFSGRLEPNPACEYILISPSECTTYIDQVVIDTICGVPEPGTILLLGLGGLALLRKRRG